MCKYIPHDDRHIRIYVYVYMYIYVCLCALCFLKKLRAYAQKTRKTYCVAFLLVRFFCSSFFFQFFVVVVDNHNNERVVR